MGVSVAVIGAGAAGLVTIRELRREGHIVTAFEQAENLGGIWLYSDDVEKEDLLGTNPNRQRVHSSLYRSVRTNLPRQIMSFSDFPLIPEAMRGMSIDSRTYPCHQEVLAFLEAFADEYCLRDAIRFSTKVIRIMPVEANGKAEAGVGGPKWAVTSSLVADGAAQKETTEVFDALVSAVGNYHEPNLPDIPGITAFPGVQLHCHNYRDAMCFAGKVVLVVGASFSGDEIAREVAHVATCTYTTARTWPPFAPAPSPGIRRLPWLTALHANGTASFEDGTQLLVDVVIYCTGYKYAYPWLTGAGLPLSTEDMHVSPLFKAVFLIATAPTLAFVGLPFKCVRFPQFELQAKLVARVLAGRAALPSRTAMQDDTQRLYDEFARRGIPVRYFFDQSEAMPVNQWEYGKQLARLCGPDVRGLEPWRRKVNAAIGYKAIFARAGTFRDTPTAEERRVLQLAAEACSPE